MVDFNWGKNSSNKLNKAKEQLGKRTGPNIQWMKEHTNDTIIRQCERDLSNGIPSLSAALTDLEEGIACLAGRPNSGKSTLLVNAMVNACDINNDLLVVDLTLDDPYKKRYQQYIAALTGLTYQEITTNTGLSETKVALREQADQKVLSWYEKDILRTIEASEIISTGGGIERTVSYRRFENIFRLMTLARKQYPEKKIVFFIDAWNNLDFTGGKGSTDLSQTNYYLSAMQEEANKLGIIIFLSAHLRKAQDKRAGLEDIKGTSDMAYNVVWAGIAKNELRENLYKKPLMYRDGTNLFPVLTIDVVKTKCSSWDLPLMYGLKSAQCGIIPLKAYEYATYYDIYQGPRE